ncbi:MAG: hypothetical protein LQ340_008113 [Diploschistes diacapsis]|nr:MAG: hypothetical protein LQ340_008113 [Diploschistes diacapsis]
MSSDSILFDETFTITSINAEKYDRVSRISATNATSGNPDVALTLDVNTELYPVAVADNLSLCLASTLAADGSKDDGRMWREIQKGESTLADHYDYVCHGKVYRFEEGDGDMM